ncbi:hypothetical protein DAEQUDRAFT_659111 [Daedalea quercina L-15889]|uniref:SGT1-domain-containing protein n=1 Tax=Daedalea quercina L-15889 TaxID=1314783 RepID=A0A165UGD5_9APHY|nr:hypothetical protein DAEQUDRAFT_659111 [Daedalea quercina L-15889]
MSVLTVSDIFNRPPTISEDTLQYALYARDDLTDRASATTLAALMRSYVDMLLPGHLWHRDAFELKVVENMDGEGWKLEGRMRVGDSVDDEWCAVWLLKELSAKWDVTISVSDSDGEYMLIEAAEALPSWVTPTNAENRVWIYESHLHLIPLSHVSAPSSKPHRSRHPRSKDSDDEGDIAQGDDDDGFITVADALKLVRDPLIDTLAPPTAEQLVWKRISGYPATARQHVHITKAYLPADIAKVLAVDSSLIQKPAETFYTRDALQLRAAHKMSRFPPGSSVLTTVKMTRTAYAQLVGQKFYPPKAFGRWIEPDGTKEWRWRDIGMKIACGFEMTYQESKGRSDASRISTEAMKSSAVERKEALRRNPDYVQYIQNLVSSGYFRGELEGSQLWNELEDRGVDAFLEARREDDATRPSFANAVNAALSRAGDVPIPTSGEEDSDDWLNVDTEMLDSMLEQNFGTNQSLNAMDVDEAASQSAEDRAAKQQAARLHEFTKKVEEFVEGEGDVEGAEFADEQSSDEEFSDGTGSEGADDSSPTPAPECKENMDAAEQARKQAAMDKLVPPLDPSHYGRMPASYYVNSQRLAPTTVETEMREVDSRGGNASVSEPQQRPIRPPIIPRDKYDGVDSDDETDEEDEAEDEEEEDKPQIVGEIEVDMEEEEEEFLEFARQALGVSDEQWGDIVRERKGRGAYIPSQVAAENEPKKSAFTTHTEGTDDAATGLEGGRVPVAGPHLNPNPKLDSFEAVMQAMDIELARMRPSKDSPRTKFTDNKGKARATASEALSVDIEAAMDAELRAALETQENSGDDVGDDEDLGEGLDYNLIKNFLESFKSQGGLPGPVGNLAGRLQPGWTLPRDES